MTYRDSSTANGPEVLLAAEVSYLATLQLEHAVRNVIVGVPAWVDRAPQSYLQL